MEVVVSIRVCGCCQAQLRLYTQPTSSYEARARPEPRCAGEIIRVWSLSTHTYCNNQEHSVLSKQRVGITVWLWLDIQQFTTLMFSWRKWRNTWHSHKSSICVLPTCTHTLPAVLAENTSTSPSIHSDLRTPPKWREKKGGSLMPMLICL